MKWLVLAVLFSCPLKAEFTKVHFTIGLDGHFDCSNFGAVLYLDGVRTDDVNQDYVDKPRDIAFKAGPHAWVLDTYTQDTNCASWNGKHFVGKEKIDVENGSEFMIVFKKDELDIVALNGGTVPTPRPTSTALPTAIPTPTPLPTVTKVRTAPKAAGRRSRPQKKLPPILLSANDFKATQTPVPISHDEEMANKALFWAWIGGVGTWVGIFWGTIKAFILAVWKFTGVWVMGWISRVFYKSEKVQRWTKRFRKPDTIDKEEANRLKKRKFFFDDTHDFRENMGIQLAHFKRDLEQGITLEAIVGLSIHKSIHDKYVEFRDYLEPELGTKINQFWNASKKFNADLVVKKQAASYDPSRQRFMVPVMSLDQGRFHQDILAITGMLDEINKASNK